MKKPPVSWIAQSHETGGFNEQRKQLLKTPVLPVDTYYKKIGIFPPELETKLQEASEKKLLDWSGRVLTTESFGDIFGH